MNAVLHAEALKLRTVRAPLLSCGLILLAVVALMTALSTAAPADEADEVVRQGLALSASLCGLATALLAALAAGAEFQHGTAVTAFLSRPRRRDVLLGRACIHAVLGFALGGLALLTGMLAALGTAERRDLDLSGALPPWLPLAVAAGTAAAAAIGVAVGTWLRSPVAAILTVVGVVTVAEPVLGSFVPGFLLPLGALGALAAGAGTVATVSTVGILAGWAGLLLALAARSLARGDIPG